MFTSLLNRDSYRGQLYPCLLFLPIVYLPKFCVAMAYRLPNPIFKSSNFQIFKLLNRDLFRNKNSIGENALQAHQVLLRFQFGEITADGHSKLGLNVLEVGRQIGRVANYFLFGIHRILALLPGINLQRKSIHKFPGQVKPVNAVKALNFFTNESWTVSEKCDRSSRVMSWRE